MTGKLCISFLLLFSGAVFAAEITKVKGSSVLIELKGDAAAPGDQFFAIGSDGKRRALVVITKVKGDKALANISKGKPDAGMTLEPRTDASGKKVARKKGGGEDAPSSRSYWGAIGGLSMDSMKVQVKSLAGTTTTNLSGQGFSGNAFFDYELFKQIWFRGFAGVEGFNVGGTSVCGNSGKEACNASIYYISLNFIARYVFATGSYRPWLGGGLSMMFPASKSSSALDPSSISNTNVIQGAAGMDFFISKNTFVPFSVEYGILPKSNEVDASLIQIRLGIGTGF